MLDADARKKFDTGAATGRDFIFTVRENLCDYLFLKTYLDQDFIDRHKLFVAGKRLDQQRMVWQYYVKSRKADDYQQMMLDSLYHPPVITVDQTKGIEGSLYLAHTFEGKQLVREYIANTLMGIEYLWGSPVYLETSEAEVVAPADIFGTTGGDPGGGDHLAAGALLDEREGTVQKETVVSCKHILHFGRI